MINLSSWFGSCNFTDLKQRLFPAMSRRSFIRHYLPMSGVVSHSIFTMNIFAPSVFAKTFPIYDLAISNAILFQSHIGIGFYVFFRPHLFCLNNLDRVEFSVFASVMYNFGSLLLSIFIKSILPKKLSVMSRGLLGILLSIFTLFKGKKYIYHIDSRTRNFKDVWFEHAGDA